MSNDCLHSIETIRTLRQRIAELEAERDRAIERWKMECGIVDRIWKLFGPPTYEQLAGRSIYDLIQAEIDGHRAALAASGPKEPKRYNLCGHPDHPDGAACQCMDPDAASEPKSDCSICRGPGKDHRHVCE